MKQYTQYIYKDGEWRVVGASSSSPFPQIHGTLADPIDLRELQTGNYLLSGRILIDDNSYMQTSSSEYGTPEIPETLFGVQRDDNNDMYIYVTCDYGNFTYEKNNQDNWDFAECNYYVNQNEISSADWSDGDEYSFAHVKNRTHYKNLGESTIIELPLSYASNYYRQEGNNYIYGWESNYTDSTEWYFWFYGMDRLVYAVAPFWNFSEEIKINKITSPNTRFYFGNLHLLDSTKTDTGENFFLTFAYNTSSVTITYLHRYGYSITGRTLNNFKFRMQPILSYKVLDKEYLPYEKDDNAEVFNDFEANSAKGKKSHAEGYQTIADGENAHAEGYESGTASNISATIAEVYDTDDGFCFSLTEEIDGHGWIYTNNDEIIGRNLNYGSLGEQSGVYWLWDADIKNRTLYEGLQAGDIIYIKNQGAYGLAAHTEGRGTVANYYAHAEGFETSANGWESHSEGYSTSASGSNSHAEGNFTTAEGINSHAEGYFTIANGIDSHAEGSYIKAGNGTVTTIDKSLLTLTVAITNNTYANLDYTKALLVGQQYASPGPDFKDYRIESCSFDVSTNTYTFTVSKWNDYSYTVNSKVYFLLPTAAIGYDSHAEGQGTRASGDAAHAEGHLTIAEGSYSHTEGEKTKATGYYAHAEGTGTRALHYGAHAEGGDSIAKGQYSHAEGSGTFANGNDSHAEGNYGIAIGNYSHSEGLGEYIGITISGSGTNYTAESAYAVSVGDILRYENNYAKVLTKDGVNFTTDNVLSSNTITNKTVRRSSYGFAYGNNSHNEGNGTIAMGTSSHSEGDHTIAQGTGSHSEGYYTQANGNYQHVQGKFNIIDNNNTYADIVGNGTNGNARSNAYTLDWNGNGEYAGSITAHNGAEILYGSIPNDQSNVFVDDSGIELMTQNWDDAKLANIILNQEGQVSIHGTGGVAIEGVITPTADNDAANKKYVDDTIAALPEPMIFKGSLGTGGTITTLPTASASNEGYTYKVITAGIYASQAAKIGDTFISDGTSWILIPSGDEPSGTVTSVTLNATSPIVIDNSAAITTSGTRTLSHANSGVSAGTYKSVTVDAKGHVTGGTNPTTLSGYGITDANINNGVITLGSNTITPLTSSSTLDATKLSGTIPSGCYTDTKYTAGSTDSSSKLFLVGATSQAANPQTYSQDTAYVGTDGHLYSNSKQVVNLSDTQALTNKTYNGYTLAGASAKAVDTNISEGTSSTNLPTSAAVANYAPIKTKTGTNGNSTITNKINVKSTITDGIEIESGAVDGSDSARGYFNVATQDTTDPRANIGVYKNYNNKITTGSVDLYTQAPAGYTPTSVLELNTDYVKIPDGSFEIGDSSHRNNYNTIYGTTEHRGNFSGVCANGSESGSWDFGYDTLELSVSDSTNTTSSSLFLNSDGSGYLSADSLTITGVVTPTNNTDAANKQYVDSKIRSGTATPSSSLGNDGDIYIKYSAS